MSVRFILWAWHEDYAIGIIAKSQISWRSMASVFKSLWKVRIRLGSSMVKMVNRIGVLKLVFRAIVITQRPSGTWSVSPVLGRKNGLNGAVLNVVGFGPKLSDFSKFWNLWKLKNSTNIDIMKKAHESSNGPEKLALEGQRELLCSDDSFHCPSLGYEQATSSDSENRINTAFDILFQEVMNIRKSQNPPWN